MKQQIDLNTKIIRRYNTSYTFAISSDNLDLLQRIKIKFKEDLGEDCFEIPPYIILKYMSRTTLTRDHTIRYIGDIAKEIERLIRCNKQIDLQDADSLYITLLDSKYIL